MFHSNIEYTLTIMEDDHVARYILDGHQHEILKSAVYISWAKQSRTTHCTQVTIRRLDPIRITMLEFQKLNDMKGEL